MSVEKWQVLGAAYTFQPSQAVRRTRTANLKGANHSSQTRDFSYFRKGTLETMSSSGEPLLLRRNPLTHEMAKHWVEAELAVILGMQNNIAGYALANDLTAYDLEFSGRTAEFDGTFYGKCWNRSGSLGPGWISPKEVDDGNLTIHLRIERGGITIYDQSYHTSRRKRPFNEIPEMIIRYWEELGPKRPPSKEISVNGDYLAPGTVIMLGTGLILPERAYSRPGDIVTISCPELRASLTNPLVFNEHSP